MKGAWMTQVWVNTLWSKPLQGSGHDLQHIVLLLTCVGYIARFYHTCSCGSIALIFRYYRKTVRVRHLLLRVLRLRSIRHTVCSEIHCTHWFSLLLQWSLIFKFFFFCQWWESNSSLVTNVTWFRTIFYTRKIVDIFDAAKSRYFSRNSAWTFFKKVWIRTLFSMEYSPLCFINYLYDIRVE
jgi:hypothetical protein